MSSRITGSGITYTDGSTQTVAGKILNVVQTVKTSVTAITSSTTTWQDIGVSASITPKSTTSKILVEFTSTTADTSYSQNSSYMKMIRIVRNSTVVGVGDIRGTEEAATTYNQSTYSNDFAQPLHAQYLDSPSTTSAITYKIQARTTYTGVNFIIGGSYYATSTYNCSTPTVLTLYEISD
jgi:hypothetical protein